ncbi:hypothetical protein [Pelagicoccus sp. SDUM812003]|uniref:hypothetical protein n=1 Tax=Pelagicoccus sp. SDUM812003 TaxID=3041267 RepID=UPI00280CDBF2|nr:hypothetical protein [Pelagicoccus sp. SDUM812003]MDQ8203149.1 hypothetical protein [Pelagicoccus sp. SDUM812003]
MDLQQFFEHWNLSEHPFQAEEARNDTVYTQKLDAAITHPDFTKIYGNPANPSTTIVFGEKGSGKTAMRLMIQQRLAAFNEGRESDKVWVVAYDELNPMLDRLASNLKTGPGEKTLAEIRLSDHQDAILSLSVTRLIDSILASKDKAELKRRKKAIKKMTPQRKIDLATLALLYDQPQHGRALDRWSSLLRLLRVGSGLDRGGHSFVTVLLLGAGVVGALGWRFLESPHWGWLLAAIGGGAGGILLGFLWLKRAWRNRKRGKQIEREIRTVAREPDSATRQLWDMGDNELASQPIPKKDDQDSRYDLTGRLLGILADFGYTSFIALVDRVDEPVLVSGDAKRIKQLVWPMLNNKFLQQERIGIKMLLPIELSQMLLAEDSEFKRQARLDKQNLVNPLKWTGTSLYDLCNWRFKNCQRCSPSEARPLDELFEDDVDSHDLIDALDQMHQPRDAFKLLYAVLLEHCRNTPGDSQQFKISKATLDIARREQSQRVVDLYRGMSST